MIEKIDITNTEVVNGIREAMPVVNIDKKGLLGAGVYGSVSIGNALFKNIVIELRLLAQAGLIVSIGFYSAPSLIGITMGVEGGASAGLPASLNVKTLCGDPRVSTAKVFHRNNRDYIQIELINNISWSSVNAFCLFNSVRQISVDGSLEYNSSTDTNLVNGTVG